jgi:hypothetical protein
MMRKPEAIRITCIATTPECAGRRSRTANSPGGTSSAGDRVGLEGRLAADDVEAGGSIATERYSSPIRPTCRRSLGTSTGWISTHPQIIRLKTWHGRCLCKGKAG